MHPPRLHLTEMLFALAAATIGTVVTAAFWLAVAALVAMLFI